MDGFTASKRAGPYSGKTMRQMVASHRGPVAPSPSSNLPVAPSPAESARNYKIAADLRTKSFMGNIITRVILPKDVPPGARPEDAREDIARAQALRAAEQKRQIAMPWNSQFMPPECFPAGRLNNPGMQQMMGQKQLATPNSYGQFYAFMRAMSAAFGSVQPGGY